MWEWLNGHDNNNNNKWLNGGNNSNYNYDSYSNQINNKYGYMPTQNEYDMSMKDGTLGMGLDNSTGGLFSNLSNTIGTVGGLSNIATGLYSMYAGNKMLKLYEHQSDVADERLAMTKTELAHKQKVRAYNSKNWNDNTGSTNKVS